LRMESYNHQLEKEVFPLSLKLYGINPKYKGKGGSYHYH
jgi:hypothetical protein